MPQSGAPWGLGWRLGPGHHAPSLGITPHSSAARAKGSVSFVHVLIAPRRPSLPPLKSEARSDGLELKKKLDLIPLPILEVFLSFFPLFNSQNLHIGETLVHALFRDLLGF